MERIYEELDGVKAENEKLRADYKSKAELCDNLKKAHSEQLRRIQESNSKVEKQAQELIEKEKEISEVKQLFEDVKCNLIEKESIIKRLSAANDKLRVDSDEKNRKWEEDNRGLVLALDEANEKNIDQEQKINVFKAEIEGLKGLLSASQKKCLEAERKAKASKELRERDDILLKLEEENRKVEDQLKWKKEQFKHLEEAHEKLKDQFKASKKEWEQERSTLVDKICSLQTSLDSQTRIAGDLQSRLQNCNQALAHEESRRKYLEVQVSEFRARFENTFAEYQDAKSQLECLTDQRDREIAAVRHSLGTKESFYKEMDYRAGRLERENQELLTSLKELQESQIHSGGSSSSLAKLRNKLRNVEHMHRDCSVNLRAKEAEWRCQLDKMDGELNDYRSELERKDATVEELKTELESCHSLTLQLKMQNEEISVMLLVLKAAVSEAELKLAHVEDDRGLHNKEREEHVSLLMKQLEMKTAALAKAQTDIQEEREKTTSLLRRIESFNLIEEQGLLMQKELDGYKETLDESARCQFQLKEKALQIESEFREKLREVCDALDSANLDLAKEREKTASLSRIVESFDRIEEQRFQMQNELEKYKEMLEESFRCQIILKEQVVQMECDSKEKLREVCDALDAAKLELAEQREKAAGLSRRVNSLDQIEEQNLLMQKELERYKEMLDESSRCQLHLKEQVVQMECDSKEKLREVCDALDAAKLELAEQREKAAGLSRRVNSLDQIEEQNLLMQKELERHKEMLDESSRCQLCLQEQALQLECDSKEKLKEVCGALDSANSELVEVREMAASLSRRVESLDRIEEHWLLMQKELERYKEMFEESSRHQLHLEEQALLIETDSKRKLKEVCDALDAANSELAEKTSEGHQIEFELWIWKSIAERLKGELEESHELRKELEASLLAQVEVGETIKQKNGSLVRILEEKEDKISNFLGQMVLLEQELNTKELEAASYSRMEPEMSFETEKESLLQITREKDKILDDLQREIECLEQESLRRELESTLLTQIGAEKSFEHDKENLTQLVEEKNSKIEDLLQLVRSLEQKFNGSLNSLSSQLAEKQAEMNLVLEAWEKISAAETLAMLEIEEKKLMIVELEDEICNVQQKLELQEFSLSHSKQQALETETELESKQLEIKKLTNQLEAKLTTSDAVIDELRSENQNLLEDVAKLLSERENVLGFMGGLGDRISKLYGEDMQLMGNLGRLVQSFGNRSGKVLEDDDELFDSVKENMNAHHSPITKKLEVVLEERSPFRQLN
ncbi:hypothetical protein ACOSP7_023505 [Xanthoceras sorbifolium]